MRMDRQRPAIGVERFAVIAGLFENAAEARPGSVMTRLVAQRFADRTHRAHIIAAQEIERRALVPAFGIIGLGLQRGIEKLQRALLVLARDEFLGAQRQKIGGVAA